MIKINTKVDVKNKYELLLIKPSGFVEKYESHNLVLDNYYNYIVSNNAAPKLTVIRVGGGSEPVTANQTTLDSLRGSYSATTTDTESVPATRVLSYTIPEGTLTGDVAEIGLSASTSGTTVYTRSLVQDAAGKAIVIEKGPLDILVIKVTVYYTFSGDALPNYIKWINPVGACTALMKGETNSIVPSYIHYYNTLFNDYCASKNANTLYFHRTSGTITKDVPTKTIRIEGDIILAGSDNGQDLGECWIAKSIGNNFIAIDIEKSGLFDPYVYNNLEIGVGDGVATEFDIPLPWYNPEDVKLKVNGVFVDEEGYQVFPPTPSASRSLSVAPSSDCTKIVFVKGSDSYGTSKDLESLFILFKPYTWRFNGANSPTGNVTVEYDFGEQIEISHVFLRNIPPTPVYSDNFRAYVKSATIDVSNDGEQWEEVYNGSGFSSGTYFSAIALPSIIVSRYVKLYFDMSYVSTSGTNSGTVYGACFAFGMYRKSIKFDNPPDLGDVITAQVIQRIPIKNSDFQLGASIQLKFERST